jgi:hypothetical protein
VLATAGVHDSSAMHRGRLSAFSSRTFQISAVHSLVELLAESGYSSLVNAQRRVTWVSIRQRAVDLFENCPLGQLL